MRVSDLKAVMFALLCPNKTLQYCALNTLHVQEEEEEEEKEATATRVSKFMLCEARTASVSSILTAKPEAGRELFLFPLVGKKYANEINLKKQIQ